MKNPHVKPPAKVIKTYSLDPTAVEAIQQLAAEDNRSASNLVETLIKQEARKRGLQLV